ncbi:hypothetical protein MAR_016726 [Mya arenaria]|uniref:Uncharacterized protein n=1 Tax=Mya arenaria TaxID=6604 RepID=A0ABY7E9P7_MYAAR|nr:hypothetical protein MAR_016726 [Mya arenaria]
MSAKRKEMTPEQKEIGKCRKCTTKLNTLTGENDDRQIVRVARSNRRRPLAELTGLTLIEVSRIYKEKMESGDIKQRNMIPKRSVCRESMASRVSSYVLCKLVKLLREISTQKCIDCLDSNPWPVIAKNFQEGDYIFQEDNAQSPDINIIENVKQTIKIKLEKKHTKNNDQNNPSLKKLRTKMVSQCIIFKIRMPPFSEEFSKC